MRFVLISHAQLNISIGMGFGARVNFLFDWSMRNKAFGVKIINTSLLIIIIHFTSSVKRTFKK